MKFFKLKKIFFFVETMMDPIGDPNLDILSNMVLIKYLKIIFLNSIFFSNKFED